MFLLSIVTLGIYRLYWFAKTRAEMMSIKKDLRIPHVIWLIAPLMLFVVALIFFIISVMTGEKDGSGQPEMTGMGVASIVIFYVAIFTVPILMALWLWKYSKGVEAVTNEKMGFAVSLLILLAVPDGIDILIVQDAFNKIATITGEPAGPVWQKP